MIGQSKERGFYFRMQHPSIREFPSQQFYDGLLKDARQLTSPDQLAIGDLPGFWAGGPAVRVVFCDVAGSEESPQDYTGPEGREESKHNPQEVQAVVRRTISLKFILCLFVAL